MTKRELFHHVELRKRLAVGMELLASLEAAVYPRDGLPDVREWTAAAIADTKKEIARTEVEITHSESAIIAFIGTIEDLQTRTVFRLRFLGGLAWRDVAEAIGGSNTEAGVRMICYRYLEARAGKGVERQWRSGS